MGPFPSPSTSPAMSGWETLLPAPIALASSVPLARPSLLLPATPAAALKIPLASPSTSPATSGPRTSLQTASARSAAPARRPLYPRTPAAVSTPLTASHSTRLATLGLSTTLAPASASSAPLVRPSPLRPETRAAVSTMIPFPLPSTPSEISGLLTASPSARSASFIHPARPPACPFPPPPAIPAAASPIPGASPSMPTETYGSPTAHRAPAESASSALAAQPSPAPPATPAAASTSLRASPSMAPATSGSPIAARPPPPRPTLTAPSASSTPPAPLYRNNDR